MSRGKLAFITQEDPFYVRIFFEEFFAHFPRLAQVEAVFIAPAMGKQTRWQLARQMQDFYGPADFVRMASWYAFCKLAARLPRPRASKRFFSIAQVCRAYGVALDTVQDVNAPAFLERLRGMKLDLIVSVAAPQIFCGNLIRVPRLGCINIHSSKLPKYRGMLPNFWQMYHGEPVIGTTIHRINDALDDGAILLQREQAVPPGDTLHERICLTKREGAHLMIEAIEQAFAGTLEEHPNERTAGSYFTFPTRKDVREFRRRGMRLL